MATFLITYDTHAGRNYQSLYDGMAEHGGVRLAESVWSIVLNNTAGEVRDWVKNLLDSDDTIIVIQGETKALLGNAKGEERGERLVKGKLSVFLSGVFVPLKTSRNSRYRRFGDLA